MKRAVLCLTLILCLFLASCQSGESAGWYDFSLSEYITVGDYKGLTYSPVRPRPVTDEMVEEQIGLVLQAHSSSEILSEGVYQAGDEIKMDFRGVYEGQIKRSSQGYTTAIGAKSFFEDFEGGLSCLIGLPLQEQHVLNLTYKADHADSEWAGKTLEFTLTVRQVTRYHTAVLDDAFVLSLGLAEKTVEEYRAALRAKLEAQAVKDAREAEMEAVWAAALGNAEMQLYPQKEIQGYLQYFHSLYEGQAKELGMDEESFMMLYYGLDEEELLANAKSVVKQDLLLYSICEKEGITLTEEEYSRFADELCRQKGYASAAELESSLTRAFVEKAALLARLQETLLGWASPQEAPAASSAA